MPKRQFSLLCLSFAIVAFAGCAPRYTTTVSQSLKPAVRPEVEATLSHAGAAYERGVDFFVKGEYDSSTACLENAISLLGEDAGWASSGTGLSERRLLVYKCRYFLERMPVAAPERSLEDELANIRPLKPQLPSIRIEENEKVQKWIRYFTCDVRTNFQTWIRRSGRYMPLTTRILKEEGMPLELTNLAMIESGFNPTAYSRAHASGIWQFIKGTGRLYGLRIDTYVDERRDPVKSCRAAARHLRDLYKMFNDWPLALAAYNSGAGNVERAIKRGRTEDYWRLGLKRETRDYVPMFMAAAIIMADPAKYGFGCQYEEALEFDEVEIEGRTDLKAVARSCQVEPAVISDLNPHLIKHCTPAGSSSCTVRVPKGTGDTCLAALARLPKEERTAKNYAAADLNHTVRRGDTLSRIAKKYGTTVSAIVEANRMKNRNRLSVGQVLAIPGEGGQSAPSNPGIHTVKKGESLSTIAEKYGVKAGDLESWNDLGSPHALYPGQKLIVAASEEPRNRVIVHKVMRGDTLNGIAQRYGTSTGTLLKTNGLRRSDKIYPGQKIRVPVRS
jgi:membrane-bound lytic murein transglycosylase D